MKRLFVMIVLAFIISQPVFAGVCSQSDVDRVNKILDDAKSMLENGRGNAFDVKKIEVQVSEMKFCANLIKTGDYCKTLSDYWNDALVTEEKKLTLGLSSADVVASTLADYRRFKQTCSQELDQDKK
jgi:hypothetical protein